MAREPFCPEISPPWDGIEDILVYKLKRDAGYKAQRAAWLREGPMANTEGPDGRLLYTVTSTGNLKRSRRLLPSARQAVLKRDNYACLHCGSAVSLEIDHIVRYIDGGSNEAHNLQTLCAPCHGKKGGRRADTQHQA